MALLSAMLGIGGGGSAKRKTFQQTHGSIAAGAFSVNQSFIADNESHVKIHVDFAATTYKRNFADYLEIYINDIKQDVVVNTGTTQDTTNSGRQGGYKGVVGVVLPAGTHNLKFRFVTVGGGTSASRVNAYIELREQ